MDLRKQRISIEDAKEMDMVNYLSLLGHEPLKIRLNDYWYLSPLREENTPSFKISRTLNRWYDHAFGKGGNLIDFGILYHNCTVAEFLEKLNDFSFQKPLIHHQALAAEKELKIKILEDFPLHSYPLINYLHQRCIPIEIAKQYCVEVRYELNDKTYYGIGFKNDSGGFEIRNPYFKSSSSPKGITTIKNGSEEAIVFEGFMDFLSFITINKNLANNHDFMILNSASFFERARKFMEQHNTIRLYLDRDATGTRLTTYALSLDKKYKDESNCYQNHKDLNDWLVNSGKPLKKHLGQKLR